MPHPALLTATAALLLATCATERPAPTGATPDASTPPHAAPMTPTEPRTLFTFDGPDAPAWSVENDGVMGGRSQGVVEIADGALRFTGTVVTEGGGFTSVRAPLQADLSAFDGIALRVRGGGRTFELDVDDGTRSRGREVNRRGAFPTTETWAVVRVPFASLESSAHGEDVDVDPLNLEALQSLGIYIIDGNDGPFRLEVDWIRAYAE